MAERSQRHAPSRAHGPVRPAAARPTGPCVGIDGCRGGWAVAVAQRGPTEAFPVPVVLDVVATFEQALASGGETAVVAVDMPIGFLDRASPGGRRCDIEARARLPRNRKASVFSPPVRPALSALTWQDARRLNGGGLSIQTFHLLPKLREVDAAMRPELQAHVFEAHPELAFLAMANGRALPPKKAAAGRADRMALLHGLFGEAVETVDAVRARCGARCVQIDDLLDALALAVVAMRVRSGLAVCLPAAPDDTRDARGLEMRIRF